MHVRQTFHKTLFGTADEFPVFLGRRHTVGAGGSALLSQQSSHPKLGLNTVNQLTKSERPDQKIKHLAPLDNGTVIKAFGSRNDKKRDGLGIGMTAKPPFQLDDIKSAGAQRNKHNVRAISECQFQGGITGFCKTEAKSVTPKHLLQHILLLRIVINDQHMSGSRGVGKECVHMSPPSVCTKLSSRTRCNKVQHFRPNLTIVNKVRDGAVAGTPKNRIVASDAPGHSPDHTEPPQP